MTTLKNKNLTPCLVVAMVLLIPLAAWSQNFPSNPPLAKTGAPGETTCGSCHDGGAGGGKIAVKSAIGNVYIPGGAKQRLTVTVSDPNAHAWGYEMTAVLASATSTGIGTFTAANTNSSVRTSGTKSYAAQINKFPGTTVKATYLVDYTPPATNVGNVILYFAGLGANNDSDTTGDSTYTNHLTLQPGPRLKVSPTSLTFAFKIGGTIPPAQNVSVTSIGAPNLNFTVTTSAAWLKATPASGTTPATLSVKVNPTGLAAGTFTGTVKVASTGAVNKATVKVTLTVTAAATKSTPKSAHTAVSTAAGQDASLGSGDAGQNDTPAGSGPPLAIPRMLNFSAGHEGESSDSFSKKILVNSPGGPQQFTAEAFGGWWLSVNPSGGNAPGRVTVTVSPEGLAGGSYTGQIKLSVPGVSSITVPVTLTVARDGEGDDTSISTTVYTYDPANTGAVAARWVYGAGVPGSDASDPTNQGLVLTNNASASSKARAGVILHNLGDTTLKVLGYDLRQGSLCSTHEPRFIVVTSDDVTHRVGGCNVASSQPAPAKGWTRFRFDSAQAVPAIVPGSTVKSIALMLDDGPDAASGMVVLDNINVNGKFVGHD